MTWSVLPLYSWTPEEEKNNKPSLFRGRYWGGPTSKDVLVATSKRIYGRNSLQCNRTFTTTFYKNIAHYRICKNIRHLFKASYALNVARTTNVRPFRMGCTEQQTNKVVFVRPRFTRRKEVLSYTPKLNQNLMEELIIDKFRKAHFIISLEEINIKWQHTFASFKWLKPLNTINLVT